MSAPQMRVEWRFQIDMYVRMCIQCTECANWPTKPNARESLDRFGRLCSLICKAVFLLYTLSKTAFMYSTCSEGKSPVVEIWGQVAEPLRCQQEASN